MIFSGDLCAKVLSGEKTQTRRLKRGYYKVGGVYAVQPGRGKKAVGHIRMKKMWPNKLGDMSSADVRAEGFDSWQKFMDTFCTLHHLGPCDWPMVWAFEFELDMVFPIHGES